MCIQCLRNNCPNWCLFNVCIQYLRNCFSINVCIQCLRNSCLNWCLSNVCIRCLRNSFSINVYSPDSRAALPVVLPCTASRAPENAWMEPIECKRIIPEIIFRFRGNSTTTWDALHCICAALYLYRTVLKCIGVGISLHSAWVETSVKRMLPNQFNTHKINI